MARGGVYHAGVTWTQVGAESGDITRKKVPHEWGIQRTGASVAAGFPVTSSFLLHRTIHSLCWVCSSIQTAVCFIGTAGIPEASEQCQEEENDHVLQQEFTEAPEGPSGAWFSLAE